VSLRIKIANEKKKIYACVPRDNALKILAHTQSEPFFCASVLASEEEHVIVNRKYNAIRILKNLTKNTVKQNQIKG
jgi:hypothetical protein